MTMNTSLPLDSVVSPFAPKLCREYEAPSSAAEKLTMTVGPVPFTSGVRPAERKFLPGYDSGVLCLIIGVFLLLAYNFRHYSTFLKNFTYDLLDCAPHRRYIGSPHIHRDRHPDFNRATCMSVRRHNNQCRPQLIGLHHASPDFPEIAALTVGAAVYYLWQLMAYRIVGYVFTDKLSGRQWLKGFNASQSLLGMALTIPALVVLFNPDVAPIVVTIGVVCYILARLIFIFKGFRLFYDNFGSLLYFILYLCTLEIVPPVIIYRCIGFFSQLHP